MQEKSKKMPPYPLDCLDEDLSNLAYNLHALNEKIKLACKNAVIVKDEKKTRIARNMLFKSKALINITDALAKDFGKLKF